MTAREDVKPETWLIVGGRPPDVPGAPLNQPPVPASNFVLGGERIYSRNEATEGWEAFEALIGGLEGGEAVAFSSGMAACAAVLGQLPGGAHLVLGDDCYQGVAGLAEAGARDRGWNVERLSVADDRWTARAQEADMLWVESPSNPLLDVADVAGICGAPRARGPSSSSTTRSRRRWASSRCASAPTSSCIRRRSSSGGTPTCCSGSPSPPTPGSFAATRGPRAERRDARHARVFLALRGARTLALRLRHASAGAAELAKRLAEHPNVGRVRYPGCGAIVSFELEDAQAADRACAAVRVARHATSLGGVETTIERRAAHPGQEHIPPGLIRMSVGCEDVDDVWADLDAALRP